MEEGHFGFLYLLRRSKCKCRLFPLCDVSRRIQMQQCLCYCLSAGGMDGSNHKGEIKLTCRKFRFVF